MGDQIKSPEVCIEKALYVILIPRRSSHRVFHTSAPLNTKQFEVDPKCYARVFNMQRK